MNQHQNKQTCLTDANYYDHETDKAFQSVSMFKSFMECEAKTMAIINDEWQPQQDPTALLVGNYVHSYFESEEAHQKFVDAHKDELLTKSGKLKAAYGKAEEMIDALKKHDRFNRLYTGDKEAIVTGEIYGVKWKGKIDCLNINRNYFIDLKTTADAHKKIWCANKHKYVSFVEGYGYYLQMAIYKRLIAQTYDGLVCEPYMVAVSKQDPPDVIPIDFTSDYDRECMNEAMAKVEELQPHIEDVRAGRVAPTRCEHCDYCRATKDFKFFVHASDLID